MLIVAGVAGYFYSSSFGTPGQGAPAFGFLVTNGWDNLLHTLTGVAGVLSVGLWARAYTAVCALLYLALGAWGLASADERALAGLLARCPWTDAFHLAVGVAALVALALTLAPRRA